MLCCAMSWRVAKPHFDDCLGRQFNRLRKASVKTATYLETHAGPLTLALPKAPLDAVIAARGDWARVDDHIETLLNSGPLGRALFTFAGLGANALTFQRAVDSLLDTVVAERFSKQAIDEFKSAAALRTEDFKAPG